MHLLRHFALILLFVAGPVRGAEVQVTIDGISGKLRDAALANLSLYGERNNPQLSPARMQLLNARAPGEIRSALQPFGYFKARVDASLTEENGIWHARYQVTLGSPVTIEQVDIAIIGPGTDDEAFQRWKDSFPLSTGDILVQGPYEQAKGQLLSLARRRGYLAARLVEHRIAVNPSRGTAVITLHFDTGPRYQFGPVRFPNEVPIGERLLHRYVPFKTGDPFDTDKLLALQRALMNSDYFQRVDVQPLPEQASNRQVPVEVHLVMKKRNRYSFGIGYGTDTGPRATAGFERRWLNRRGHRLSGAITTSHVLTEASLSYRIPMRNPSTDYLAVTGDRALETTDTSSRDTGTIGVSLTSVARAWLQTLSLDYLEEAYTVAGATNRSTMVVPGIGWQRVVAPERVLPRHGWRLALTLRGTRKEFGSSTDLVQGQLRYKHIGAFLDGRVISRLDAGASETSDFAALPVSYRFFAGGDESVRGYAYQSLGPTENGEVTGGKDLLVGSLEYDRFWGNKGAAIFVDEGNAFNSTANLDLKRGIGAGFRYRLPFGLIRIDVASAVSKPGRPWRLHLSIGPEL